MNEEEANGIKAIIFLQAMAGTEETEEQAKSGWAGMSDSEKRQTLFAYKMFNGGKHIWKCTKH